MVQCHLCQKELGRFDKKISKLVDGKKVFFCPVYCADVWPRQQKESAILSLYSRGEPTVLFTIPSVKIHYEDEPGQGLFGPLLFTNDALCFAQLVVAETRNPFYSMGYKFGAALRKATHGSAENGEIEIGPSELKRIVDDSSRLIVLPKEVITEIKYKNGVQVKIGNKSHYFEIFGDKKEAATRFESLVLGYLK